MKKKMSLIQLNQSEIKKNQNNRILREELENSRGGAKCAQPTCWCSCYPWSEYFDDNQELAQQQYLENFEVNNP